MFEYLKLFVSALRSLVAYFSVAFYVLVVAPPGMALALFLGRPNILYWLGRGGARLGMATVGINYQVTGLEHVRADRPTVYCVNHASNVEPPILFMALHSVHPRLKILYKAELRRVFPVLRRAFDIAGFVPIERGNRDRSMQAIDAAALSLRQGNSFLIFPEGTRSRTGKLLAFKKGGFVMAIKGKSDIIPMAIQGSSSAMRKGSPVIHPVTVRVRLGKPIETNGLSLDERDELIKRTRSEVRRLLEQNQD